MSHHESQPSESLPLKPIPGGYGLPFFGAIKDRYDYFYNQGRDEFFRFRRNKYKSTVFRANMPPGPFIASNPNVVVLLDAASFPVLFDTSKVEKKNVFDGTFMPSTGFTGGYRVCSFLDPSEPKHKAIKSYVLYILASKHNEFIPILSNSLSHLFTNLENELSSSQKKEANFNTLSDDASFNFFFQLFCNKTPEEANLGSKSNTLVDKWLLPQVAPLITFNKLPKFLSFIEDLLIHTFPLPSFLVNSGYKKVYDAFYSSAGPLLDEAGQRFGIERDEACHNLVFLAGFNSYGGLKVLFPALIKWIGLAGESLHRRLRGEIRTVVEEEGGVTFGALEKMSLTKSVVYEVLRIEPPVPFQYGHAKEDMVVKSHDASFEVKKGEMIFGFQPFATRDPKVFERAEEFVADRFVGEGQKLLKYVLWSNGRETDDPTADNKQCPAKDFVVFVSRVFLVEFFLHYDAFEVEAGTLLLGSSATIKSLTKRA
ncbi:Allene oxide synthase [Parasponia andersonii]|uniref:Allene oxide synthase n=1 Tax=Parasponia andersonii TaxID=3476 RepID=A0A2P5DAY6_PARAD|nr:Allene oxide synthase [Parasponia andersonii]